MKLYFIWILILSVTLFSCSNRVQTPDTDGKEDIYTQLEDAIREGNKETFGRLVALIPDMDSLIYEAENQNYYTLLGYACKYRRCDFAESLIGMKADIETGMQDEIYAYDALFVAIESQDTCIVKLLLDKGADPNRWYNEDGLTALAVSCRLNNYAIAGLLLEYGANVDGGGSSETDYVHYPLLYAVENNNLELVRLLIEHNCILYAEDKQGETALSIADRNGNKEMAALLLESTLLRPE